MKAKFIKESIGVLAPKSVEDISNNIPTEYKELIDECYNLLSSQDNIEVEEIGFIRDFVGNFAYGFYFHTPSKTYTIQYIPKDGWEDTHEGVFMIDEDREGNDIEIKSIGNLMFKLHLYEPVQESITDVLKPKSDKEFEEYFKNKFPAFVEIQQKMFPGSELNLSKGEEGIDANFAFTITDDFGDKHTFMVSQSRHKPLPTIAYLDKSRANASFGGIFLNQQTVGSHEDVKRYIEKIVNPIYDRRERKVNESFRINPQFYLDSYKGNFNSINTDTNKTTTYNEMEYKILFMKWFKKIKPFLEKDDEHGALKTLLDWNEETLAKSDLYSLVRNYFKR